LSSWFSSPICNSSFNPQGKLRIRLGDLIAGLAGRFCARKCGDNLADDLGLFLHRAIYYPKMNKNKSVRFKSAVGNSPPFFERISYGLGQRYHHFDEIFEA
jgi:hypothetical protein